MGRSAFCLHHQALPTMVAQGKPSTHPFNQTATVGKAIASTAIVS